ncbi:Unknown protein, partial [Striga hermonthica]
PSSPSSFTHFTYEDMFTSAMKAAEVSLFVRHHATTQPPETTFRSTSPSSTREAGWTSNSRRRDELPEAAATPSSTRVAGVAESLPELP